MLQKTFKQKHSQDIKWKTGVASYFVSFTMQCMYARACGIRAMSLHLPVKKAEHSYQLSCYLLPDNPSILIFVTSNIEMMSPTKS